MIKAGTFFNNRFYVIDKLSHGGMGIIFLGYDLRDNRFVAIKTMFEELSHHEQHRNRFHREGDIYRNLNHPNIVRLVQDDCTGVSPYIVLEFVRGRPLSDLISVGGALPLSDSFAILEALTNALFHAHVKGVIHRDLKPHNVLITPEGVIKLIDFGIAYMEDVRLKTEAGAMMGTYMYASPEQNQGNTLDERSDQYSLGLLLFECLTGERALKGRNVLEVVRQQLAENLPALRDVAPEVPEIFEELIDRMTRKEPADRFSGTRHLVDAVLDIRLSSAGELQGRLFPDPDAKLWELTMRHYLQGRYVDALEGARQIAEHQPDSARVHFLLGKLYAAREVPYYASESFQKAMKLAPERMDYAVDFASALLALGWVDKARAEVSRILDLDSGNLFAKGLNDAILRGAEMGFIEEC